MYRMFNNYGLNINGSPGNNTITRFDMNDSHIELNDPINDDPQIAAVVEKIKNGLGKSNSISPVNNADPSVTVKNSAVSAKDVAIVSEMFKTTMGSEYAGNEGNVNQILGAMPNGSIKKLINSMRSGSNVKDTLKGIFDSMSNNVPEDIKNMFTEEKMDKINEAWFNKTTNEVEEKPVDPVIDAIVNKIEENKSGTELKLHDNEQGAVLEEENKSGAEVPTAVPIVGSNGESNGESNGKPTTVAEEAATTVAEEAATTVAEEQQKQATTVAAVDQTTVSEEAAATSSDATTKASSDATSEAKPVSTKIKELNHVVPKSETVHQVNNGNLEPEKLSFAKKIELFNNKGVTGGKTQKQGVRSIKQKHTIKKRVNKPTTLKHKNGGKRLLVSKKQSLKRKIGGYNSKSLLSFKSKPEPLRRRKTIKKMKKQPKKKTRSSLFW
jgi:hypothetical protein